MKQCFSLNMPISTFHSKPHTITKVKLHLKFHVWLEWQIQYNNGTNVSAVNWPSHIHIIQGQINQQVLLCRAPGFRAITAVKLKKNQWTRKCTIVTLFHWNWHTPQIDDSAASLMKQQEVHSLIPKTHAKVTQTIIMPPPLGRGY